MNSDETARYITFAVAIFGPILVRWGVPLPAATDLLTDLINAGVQLAPAVGAAAFAIWQGWNKRLVHENAVVTSVAPTVAMAKDASVPAGK
jgi:hypothetical protein